MRDIIIYACEERYLSTDCRPATACTRRGYRRDEAASGWETTLRVDVGAKNGPLRGSS
jgi:hypothetical protein